MKIIDNKKDYYDYLAGINGIDDYVVYDRRNSVPNSELPPAWFSKKKEYFDKDKTKYDIGILIGTKLYLIHLLRIPDENSVILKPIFSSKQDFDRSKIASKAPIVLSSYYNSFSLTRERHKSFSYSYNTVFPYGKIIENPIMKDTWIPSIIPAEEIWYNIYSYLLSLKEPVIVDNRTDVQHLQAAGFDKKTSFRKM